MIAKRLLTGSTVMPSFKRGRALLRTPRTFYGNGGAEESTYDNELPIG